MEIIGIESGLLNAGIGYVIIPEGIDPDVYKANCYKRQEVAIWAGFGHANYFSVAVDEYAMQRIKFPTKVSEKGSPVVWVKIPKFNLPVVVATLKYKDDHYVLEENTKRFTCEKNDILVDVLMDANDGKLLINVIGDSENPANVEIRVKSPNKQSSVLLESDGFIELIGSKKVTIKSEAEVGLELLNISNKKTTEIKYLVGEGFSYKDEFGNSIEINENEISINSPSKKIKLLGAKDKIVLGTELTSFLSELIKAIISITVTTPSGNSGTPINATQFTSLANKLNQLLSDKIQIE
jgi:hypothetical protein